MAYRSLLIALLFGVGLPGISTAGVIEVGNPGGDELRGKLEGVRLAGKITGFKVTNKHGRTVQVRLPHPQSLETPISLPDGEWAEITLLLAGPVTVYSGATSVVLAVDSLTVPLEDPGAHEIHLDWTLPADLSALSPNGLPKAALILALQDGGLATP